MSKQLFKLTREGNFTTKKQSTNQCGNINVFEFAYKLECLFNPVFNKQGFLIKHELIDDKINSLNIKGSCEQMHTQIGNEINKFLRTHCEGYIGYRLTITPYRHIDGTLIKYKAYMQSTNLTAKHIKYL